MRSFYLAHRISGYALATAACVTSASFFNCRNNCYHADDLSTPPLRGKYRYLVAGGGTTAHSAAQCLASEDPGGSLLIVAPWWPGNPPGCSEDGGSTTCAPGTELVAIDSSERTATLSDGTEVRYEKALLAIGGDTPRPPVGTVVASDAKKYISGVRSPYERSQIIHLLSRPPKPEGLHFTVAGGGWVALSTGAELLARGADVTFVYSEPALLARQVPKYVSNEIRTRIRYMSEGAADFLAYGAIRHVAKGTFFPGIDEAEVHAGVVFDPLAGVQFRTDHVLLAPTAPPAPRIEAPALELRDGLFVTNRELAVASDLFAAGACASVPGGESVRWSQKFAWTSGIHAARNMMGARKAFVDIPRYTDVFLPTLCCKCRVIGDVDGSYESLGYFTCTKELADETCGGGLEKGVVFFLERRHLEKGMSGMFAVAGALFWHGAYSEGGDATDEKELTEAALSIIDAPPRERGQIEKDLDTFAATHFGVAREVSERGEGVGRVLCRRHVAARNTPLPKEEILWLEHVTPGTYSSAEDKRAEAYVELLRRSAGRL